MAAEEMANSVADHDNRCIINGGPAEEYLPAHTEGEALKRNGEYVRSQHRLCTVVPVLIQRYIRHDATARDSEIQLSEG